MLVDNRTVQGSVRERNPRRVLRVCEPDRRPDRNSTGNTFANCGQLRGRGHRHDGHRFLAVGLGRVSGYGDVDLSRACGLTPPSTRRTYMRCAVLVARASCADCRDSCMAMHVTSLSSSSGTLLIGHLCFYCWHLCPCCARSKEGHALPGGDIHDTYTISNAATDTTTDYGDAATDDATVPLTDFRMASFSAVLDEIDGGYHDNRLNRSIDNGTAVTPAVAVVAVTDRCSSSSSDAAVIDAPQQCPPDYRGALLDMSKVLAETRQRDDIAGYSFDGKGLHNAHQNGTTTTDNRSIASDSASGDSEDDATGSGGFADQAGRGEWERTTAVTLGEGDAEGDEDEDEFRREIILAEQRLQVFLAWA